MDLTPLERVARDAEPAASGQHARAVDAERERDRAREAEARLAFLAEASRLLGSSLDYETTLANVARLAMPALGAWCVVDLCEANGSMRRLAVVHPDPEKQALARQLESGWPPARDDPFGAPAVMRTRRSEVIPEVSDEMLVRAARGEDNLRVLRALGIGSLMTVPLVARGHVLGAITFASAASGRPYAERDLTLAEDLAARSAMAVDNARLYRDARRGADAEAARTVAEDANRAKGQFLATMSHELRTPLNAITGYAELLELGIRGPVTDRQREDLQRIQRNGRHLLSLINDVLNFAKLEAGRVELHVTDVPLAEALAGVEALVAPQLRAKGLRYESPACDPEPVHSAG